MRGKKLLRLILLIVACFISYYLLFFSLSVQNHQGQGHHFSNCVTLHPGPFDWTAWVDGNPEHWRMQYSNQSQLPVTNTDAKKHVCVNFMNNSYYLWQVDAGYIQLGSTP